MDRLPDENGDDPRGLTQDARAVAKPQGAAVASKDAMALLRQAANFHQAKQGNVSSPAIEANKAAQAANGEALKALKYSVHGIPEGLNHVDEMERLKGLINMGTASANDLDNFITLEQFMNEQSSRTNGEAGAVEGILGGNDGEAGAIESILGGSGGASQPASVAKAAPARAAQSEVPASAGAARSMRGQSSGAGQPASRPGMDRGQVPASRVQSGAGARGPAGGPQPAMAKENPKKPSVDMSYLSDDEGPVNKTLMSRPGAKVTGEISGNFNRLSGPPLSPNVNPYKMASKGMSFEPGEREQNIQRAYQSGDTEGGRLMLEYSGAKDPVGARAAAAEEDSGAQSVNMPKVVRTGGGAAGSILMNKAGATVGRAGTSAGRRVGAGIETAKAVASPPSMGEPTMKPMTGKAPAISRPGTQQVGPRPEPRKINVDARPSAPKPKATEAPKPKPADKPKKAENKKGSKKRK